MAIIVTGTPGTGKTTLARKLAKEYKYEYLDLNEFSQMVGAIEGRDPERDTLIVDEHKVVAALEKALRKNSRVVIDGHFSHELSPKFVEKCYVTRTKLPELKARLENRKYSEKKIRENLDAEIFDTCGEEARANGHTTQEVWT